MAKRRLKKKVKYALLGIVALIVLIVVLSIVIKTNKLHNSIEYKLEKLSFFCFFYYFMCSCKVSVFLIFAFRTADL